MFSNGRPSKTCQPLTHKSRTNLRLNRKINRILFLINKFSKFPKQKLRLYSKWNIRVNANEKFCLTQKKTCLFVKPGSSWSEECKHKSGKERGWKLNLPIFLCNRRVLRERWEKHRSGVETQISLKVPNHENLKNLQMSHKANKLIKS